MTTTAGRWTKLYGSLIDGDALAMSRDARLLGVEAEAWSDDQETDGRIPRNALRRITDAEDPATLVAELVSTGRWVESDEGWTVVGFLDRHDAADARAAARADDAARIKGWRAHRDGKHNADGPKSCDRCNGVRNGVTNAVRTEVEATQSLQVRTARAPLPTLALRSLRPRPTVAARSGPPSSGRGHPSASARPTLASASSERPRRPRGPRPTLAPWRNNGHARLLPSKRETTSGCASVGRLTRCL